MKQAFVDGSINYPGCNCGPDCSLPCWQRHGIAPACEACGCAAFAEPAPNDRADELANLPDLWPEIRGHVRSAIIDVRRTIAAPVDEIPWAHLETKYRKGEAEHGRDWLGMTRQQIEQEVTAEWLDLVLYRAMLRARFQEAKG